MAFVNWIKRIFGFEQGAQRPKTKRDRLPLLDQEPEPNVREVTVSHLKNELASGADLLLIDCREPRERRHGHIRDDLYVPMNNVPNSLKEITLASADKQRQIVVYCATGMRSFGVAHYLNENGFNASSLAGGIARWQIEGGPIEVDA